MSHRLPKPSPTWLILSCVGIGAALVGFGAAFLSLALLASSTSLPDREPFSVAAALATLLITPLCWWCFIIKPNRLTLRRGIGIGILCSVAAHPLTWFLAGLIVSFTGRSAVMGLPMNTPYDVLFVGPIIYTGASLVLVGWLTGLVGGIAGGVLISAQRACCIPLR